MTTDREKPVKPLGRKAYGSIPHLPGSRLGPAEHTIHPGQFAICCEKARDRHDRVWVTEKLDGSNVAVARIGGDVLALNRAGYLAEQSPHEQHRHFAAWVRDNEDTFRQILPASGESVLHGEWLALAHGTVYRIARHPFVAFELNRSGVRVSHDWFKRICAGKVPSAETLNDGEPISLEAALSRLGSHGHHGAQTVAEGLVYRVERRGDFDFLAKYVRPEKVDGCYLPDISGKSAIWNWRHPSFVSEAA